MSAGDQDFVPAPISSALLAFLKSHPPFDELEADALRFLCSRLRMGYYGAGTRILEAGQAPPSYLYIVRSGLVQHVPDDSMASADPVQAALEPGECFPLDALLERQSVRSAYVSAADTFCLQLPAAAFTQLIQRSARFQEFSTNYLASLLRDSRRLLKMHHASRTAEQQALGRTLRSLLTRDAVACSPQATIGSALRLMQRQATGSVVVVDERQAPIGIFTRHDVLDRVALGGRSLEEPIASVMTPDPHTLPAEADAYEAGMLIAEHGIRHVPVVDEDRLIGVVSERDLFALQRIGIRSIHRTIAAAAHTTVLEQAARDIHALARTLTAEGFAAEPTTLIISTLNDALTRRVIEMERSRHDLAGLAWCWLAFGSEGRHEQTIATDQDNGILFVDREGQDRRQTRQRLVAFAQAVNRILDACGYPLCKGNIMAGNPQWCLSRDEWAQHFADWIANTDPQALLSSAIFFDFRSLYGPAEPVKALREELLERVAATPRFLRQLSEQAIAVRPPLGLLKDFVTEEDAEGRQTLNLKSMGVRLFVDAVRVIALAAGVAHTSTAQRLRLGGARIGLSKDEIGSGVEAFFFLQMLRLRRQAFGTQPGGADAHNSIEPADLNEVDRRMLKECLRQARKLQARLALDYGL